MSETTAGSRLRYERRKHGIRAVFLGTEQIGAAVQLDHEPGKPWLCTTGRGPLRRRPKTLKGAMDYLLKTHLKAAGK